MKSGIRRRTISLIVAVLVAVAFMPVFTGAAVFAESAPQPDVEYTGSEGWEEGTLVIDENKTVRISGVKHDNTYTEYGSAIKICNNATVNLVFEGENVLSGNPVRTSAGIEVEAGSTVNIYGLDGSTLRVTGGKESAGIGGRGYDSTGVYNPKAGNINIYSGNITAIGGNNGAGIGSGYHSSASVINIKGGNITALGTGCGAGIGSGYGTSGGAAVSDGNPTGAGVGFYNGGNITISGGTVRAAGLDVDFDSFDQYDPSSLGTSSNMAAGIGGGYGASSGKILVEGNADVIAIGSAGAAGIGTGRGATNKSRYDAENAFCDVTISGNSNVVAMSIKDSRAHFEGTGGAGIGLGNGWGLEEDSGIGSVAIKDNAKVYAYAAVCANGIGASNIVSTSEISSHLDSLSIGPGCTVAAISDKDAPARAAFDEKFVPDTIPAAELSFNEEFFESAGIGSETPFFNEDRIPAIIDVRSAESGKLLTSFPLTHKGVISAGVHIPAAYSNVYYIVRDQKADGRGVLLAKSDGDNGWKFEKAKTPVTNLLYEKYGITYNLDGGRNASGNPAEYAVYGPAVTLKAPSRSGYTFDGWYGNSGLSGAKVTSIPAGSVGDKAVWAKWKKNSDSSASVFIAKMTSKGKRSMEISWNKVDGAEGYDIFFSHCGSSDHKEATELVKSIAGNSTFKWTKSGLGKSNSYKAVVKAYVNKGNQKVYIKTSPLVHAYTSGGTRNYTNARIISIKKTKVSLKKGKTHRIKARVKPVRKGKKLLRHVAKLRYVSSDPKVAKVSKGGRVTGKRKGSCVIYVYAHNGVSKAVKVTVK